MAALRSIDEADLRGSSVLVRVEFNTPLEGGKVADDTRIRAALPTIEKLLSEDCKVVLMSHLGRPKGEGYEEAYSLAPVASHLAGLVSAPVRFCPHTIGPEAQRAVSELSCGEVLVLENLRFDPREKKNDPAFAEELAKLGNVYVDDAFGVAHRAHASNEGITHYLPSYAGYLMLREVETLSSMLEAPKRPFVGILGGSKVSDKIAVIDSLLDKCDTLIVGGGMCFTFLMAQGYSVGASLKEKDWVSRASDMLSKAQEKGVDLLLPSDVVCADRFAADAAAKTVGIADIPDDMMGLDIGPETAGVYAKAIEAAGTVFWNGPMGVFEMDAFAAGTKAVAEAVAACAGDTIIGGGDSVAAVNKFGLADRVGFVSTGGGASMELVQGEILPGVEALRKGEWG